MNDELLEAYHEVIEYFDCLEFLIKHRIPFEDWPEEIQGIAKLPPGFLDPIK